ncbi:metal-sensitive transcriptional regulator [Lentilactobacillus senioris]|uniref:metal-sensitive transcriptional regulator n=1 Tax=Lentilactobacillus senioris TaxID=931534 RepID=UPI0006D00A39|nr:metal-sensitive transcriptional regulator [Lentilactobacillus senioris]
MPTCDKTVLNRLKRTEGQLRGIQKMISEEKDCTAIVTQLSAVRSSVDHIMGGLIVAENLKSCFENPEIDAIAQEAKVTEAIKLIMKK